MGSECLVCGGTGKDCNGNPCTECGSMSRVELPFMVEVPTQYQNNRFEKSFLPEWLQNSGYGSELEKIIKRVETEDRINTNYLICSPPNSGKTTFAYTVYGIMYSRGLSMPPVKDLLEFKRIYSDYYTKEYELIDKWSNAPLAIFKIPYDIPSKFPEIIHTIIDIRSRNNGSTIFTYDGSKQDLINQDTFGKTRYLFGDGSFHSVKVINYFQNEEGAKNNDN